MDFQVLITDAAVDDVREIVEFVAETNPAAADRVGEKLLARALSLRVMAERFPLHDRIRNMPIPPYRVFYRCDETKRVVYILHFWHGARRFPDLA